jgi:hypothetical protein
VAQGGIGVICETWALEAAPVAQDPLFGPAVLQWSFKNALKSCGEFIRQPTDQMVRQLTDTAASTSN